MSVLSLLAALCSLTLSPVYLFSSSPLIVTASDHAFKTIVMKGELTASIVFSSMAVFEMLQQQLHEIFNFITTSIAGKVSVDRINEFLKNVSAAPIIHSHRADKSLHFFRQSSLMLSLATPLLVVICIYLQTRKIHPRSLASKTHLLHGRVTSMARLHRPSASFC